MQRLFDQDASSLRDAIREHYRQRDFTGVVNSLTDVAVDELVQEPELGFMLADSARRVGGFDAALDLCAAVVDSARASRNMPVLCDALNLQGVLLLEHGEPHAAERAWCDLVMVATTADSPEFVARASNNLGVAAILSMRLQDAIASFQRSVTAYLRLGYSRGLAQSHHNLGIVFRELDHEQESYANFERALTWAYAADCMDEVARVEEELALLLLYSGKDVETAEATAQQALARFTALGQPAGIAGAMRVIGVVALARGRHDEAETALTRALDGARERGLRLLEAESLLALSVIARTPADRQIMQQQAAAILGPMDAEAWGEQVLKRMTTL